MELPDDVLAKIYRGNFTRIAGTQPRVLNVPKAVEVCSRLAAIAEAMSGAPPAETEAGKVRDYLLQRPVLMVE